MVGPSWTWYPARQAASAWASVLQATSSTPSRPAATMVSIALPPAPPTPTTVMRGLVPVAVARSIVMRSPPASARIIARTGMLGGHRRGGNGPGPVIPRTVDRAGGRAVDDEGREARQRREKRQITTGACRSSWPPLIEDQRPDRGCCQDKQRIADDDAERLTA